MGMGTLRGLLLGAGLAVAAQPALAQDFSWMFAEGKPADIRTIISGSMTPALQVGDRIAIFTMVREPKRGDVVMFTHPRNPDDVPWVKRVVGLPGDRVQVAGGRLMLNGVTVGRTLVREITYLDPHDWETVVTVSEYTEQLPGEDAPHVIHEFSDAEDGDDTPEFIVPEGHLFMMGDNRDISADSREPEGHLPLPSSEVDAEDDTYATLDDENVALGFVPVETIIGRVRTVMLSVNPCRKKKAEEVGAECLAPWINKPM